jgi:hypothetical protein
MEEGWLGCGECSTGPHGRLWCNGQLYRREQCGQLFHFWSNGSEKHPSGLGFFCPQCCQQQLRSQKQAGQSPGDSNGDVDNAIACPGENFVLAAKDTSNAAKLSKMCSDGGIRQVGRDASEVEGGDGVAGCPAIDGGVVADLPGDTSNEAIQITPGVAAGILAQARCRQFHPQKL